MTRRALGRYTVLGTPCGHRRSFVATGRVWGRRQTWILGMQLAAALVLGMIATGAASIASGCSAQAIGYGPHFVLAAVLCVVAIVVVARLFPQEVSR